MLPAGFLERYPDVADTAGKRLVAHRMLRAMSDDFLNAPTEEQLSAVGTILSGNLGPDIQDMLDAGDYDALTSLLLSKATKPKGMLSRLRGRA